MSGHCPKCGAYCEEDDDRVCGKCASAAATNPMYEPPTSGSGNPSAANVHGMNCAHLGDPDDLCNCGMVERVALETERTMHAAWRKRAEEAEAERDSLTRSIVAACEGSGCLNAHELRKALDAEREAVRVLGDICKRITDGNPDHDRDFLAWMIENITNPIAAAAVKGKQ